MHSNDILVLIQPALAGPDVDPTNYWQPECILWPPDLQSGDGGRLLSLVTGADWVGDPGDFQFDAVDHGRAWRSREYERQLPLGRFQVRDQEYGQLRTALLVGPRGSASRNALRLALNGDSPLVVPHRFDAPVWPRGALMVGEAASWDEVELFVAATTGRVLVVEYPPKEDASWTRFWIKGRGWRADHRDLRPGPEQSIVPEDPSIGVPGLIEARRLIPLVVHPKQFRSVAVDVRYWPGANRFVDMVQIVGPWFAAGWMLVTALAMIWGATLVATERTSRFLPVLLSGLILSPAVVSLAGWMTRFVGIGAWPVCMTFSLFSLLVAASWLAPGLRRWAPAAHPLLPTFAVGLITLLLADPKWSLMSSVFAGRPSSVPAIALGSLFGYLGGVVTSLQDGDGRLEALARWVCLLVPLVGLVAKAWWAVDPSALIFCAAFAVIVGERRLKRWMIGVAALWPGSLWILLQGGVAWRPLGLLESARGRYGLNLAEYIDFLLSPGLAIFLFLFGAISLFGYRFFFHQLRALVKLDRRRRALPWLATSAAAFGILHPSFLPSSLVVAVGAAAALLFDAVQTM